MLVGYGLGFWAGSLSPVCREGSHDDVDDDGDEVLTAWTRPVSPPGKTNARIAVFYMNRPTANV